MSSQPRRLLLVTPALLLAPFVGTLPAHAETEVQAKREIRRLEREWSNAFNSRNAKVLNRLLAANFVFVDPSGKVMNKAGYVDMVVNHIRVISGDIHDLDIRIHGSTAVAVARFTGKTTFDGQPSNVSFRFIDVWAKRGGKWIAVSSQDTTIAD